MMILSRKEGFFKKAEYTIEVSKEGYETISYPLNTVLDGGSYIGGNFLMGMFWGWFIIDPATGGMWELTDEEMYLYLEENPGSSISYFENSMKVIVADETDRSEIFMRKPVNG